MRIDRLREEFDIDVKWRAFPLHPEVPREGIRLEDLFRHTTVNVVEYAKRLKRTADELGLPFADERSMTFNTRRCQELGLWAESMGKGHAFHMAAFRACLAESRNLADETVLLDIAESAGLVRADAKAALDGRAFSDAVDRDWEDARRMEITAVPTVVLNGRRMAGFHPYGTLARLVTGRLF